MESCNKLKELESVIIDRVCDEYESLWLVDAKSLKMQCYRSNSNVAIPGSEDFAQSLNYDDARRWYAQHFIVEDDKERVLRDSATDAVFANIHRNEPYTVNYKRIIGDSINLNQMFFANLETDGDDIVYFLMGFRDVDRRRRAEIDEITGLYNRRSFVQHADELREQYPDKKYDIIVTDFVDFKQINEKYGMKTGDKILETFGLLLRERFGSHIYIGRYGGDQIAAIIEHDKFEEEADAIISCAKKIGEMGLPAVNIKCGHYKNIEPEERITTICDRAHTALNTIKHSYGQEIAVFDESIRKQVETMRNIENSMHEALEKEQFKVYYQPKHDANTGKLVGAEALIRWIHPKYGFISPGDFIPLFERNGFVYETDTFVWSHTCKNIRKWLDKGLDVVPVSINASKVDFKSMDYPAHLMKAVNENNIPVSMLHLEVTESMMAENINALIGTLKEIRDEGIKIELDDFGSGYSSLNILSEIPLDVLKLDMSFMKQLGDMKRTKVLAACINLGRNLGYKTVSEGVETSEQYHTLKILGVDEIQGYYFSKPLPEEEFEQYLREQNK